MSPPKLLFVDALGGSHDALVRAVEQSANCEVTTADSYEGLLRVLSSSRFDLAVFSPAHRPGEDWMLPAVRRRVAVAARATTDGSGSLLLDPLWQSEDASGVSVGLLADLQDRRGRALESLRARAPRTHGSPSALEDVPGALPRSRPAAPPVEPAGLERAIARGSFVPFLVCDEQGWILDANDAAARAFGTELSELLQTDVQRLHPALARDAHQRSGAHVEERGPIVEEARLVRRDGTSFPARVQVSPFWSDGSRLWILQVQEQVGSTAPAPERSESVEQTRRRSAARLAAVGRISLLALHGGNVEKLLQEVVHAVAEALDVPWCDYVEVDARSGAAILRASAGWEGLAPGAVVGGARGALARGGVLEREAVRFDAETEDGAPPEFLHHRGTPIRSGLLAVVRPEEGASGVLGAYDASDRKRTRNDEAFLRTVANVLSSLLQRVRDQKQLTRSQERLQLALEGGDLGLWSVDLVSGEVFFDRRWTTMLGYTAAELGPTFRSWLRLIHRDDRKAVLHKLRAHLEGRRPNVEAEYRIRTKDGGHRWIFVKGKVVARANDGTPLRISGTHLDVHRRISLEEQLRHAQKMEALGTLSGGVAHDFNNVLQSISGNAELLAEHVDDDPDSRQHVQSILRASDRAAGVVKKILAFCRQEEPLFQRVDLVELLEELYDLLRHSIPRTVLLTRRAYVNVAPVRADAGQLMQVFLNLAANSVQATREEGQIEIELDRRVARPRDPADRATPPMEFVIAFRDWGDGIAAENMHRIFDPFFTTKKRGEGTGLGLSLVHGIVEGHGGRIEVESTPQAGTTFSVFLPELEQEEPSEAPSIRELPRGTERILVLDDEEPLADLLRSWLGNLGYRVEATSDPEEALARIAADPEGFDLLLTDHAMPGMTGVVVAERARALRPGLQVLIMSGWTNRVTAENLSEFGQDRLLAKPFRMRTLAQTVRATLDGETA